MLNMDYGTKIKKLETLMMMKYKIILQPGDVKEVSIKSSSDYSVELLFDNNHSIEEKILKEQFVEWSIRNIIKF